MQKTYYSTQNTPVKQKEINMCTPWTPSPKKKIRRDITNMINSNPKIRKNYLRLDIRVEYLHKKRLKIPKW